MEQVEAGLTGLRLPPDDSQVLAVATLDLLADPAQRVRMGSAASATIVKRYSLEMQANRYLYWFEAVLQSSLP